MLFSNKKRLLISLNTDVYKALKEYCNKNDINKNELISELISNEIKETDFDEFLEKIINKNFHRIKEDCFKRLNSRFSMNEMVLLDKCSFVEESAGGKYIFKFYPRRYLLDHDIIMKNKTLEYENLQARYRQLNLVDKYFFTGLFIYLKINVDEQEREDVIRECFRSVVDDTKNSDISGALHESFPIKRSLSNEALTKIMKNINAE